MGTSIKAILFDLGNVIVSLHTDRLEKAYAEAGRKLKDGEVLSYFNESDNINRYMEGRLNSSQFYSKTKRIFRLKMKFREFYQHWNSIFSPFPGTEEIIRNLKKDYPDIKLLLLSNTNESHYDFIRDNYKILELLDGHIASHETGCQKPHPDIFKAALKLADTLPKETIYTDDRQDLIDAARVMGIRAYRFTTAERFRSDLARFDIHV
ncbi:MAG: HAD hydrolase-like protein [Candidatus Omnitrophica bacterium]|nr:HAD hydrolase-like protein [Candidatus Omnitrophota bacterium]